ncbi:hypothetical protein LSO07_04505 [Janthinobacterium sp. PLB04]|uniref:Uncharacterized protein n=1 Tax=Janthinobacterium lividum TaxID=29581 RepID=A0AAJ4T647_9BURK|nr:MULTISPECIES: hypothetical protein [Janthinobacterium]KAB0331008.1 hypothetical protein F3B38_04475 [Janthinobacterium lividum]QSX97220.1 hypothetical protein J3P46_04505 [Janthinobacterium lividum]UGQ37144.1 hypothetical protein LSO07_04505 [Janthinobacterium sp. PLB04]
MNFLSNILAGFPSFDNFLPATALVAILIFLVREYVEGRRRKSTDARKVLALKKVLARDCQLNYHAIDMLRDAMIEMKEVGVAVDAARLSLSKREAGGYSFTLTDFKGSYQGGVLLGIQRETLLKYLVEIAGLDESLYSKCVIALDGLSEADNVYQSLVHGPEKHFPSTDEDYYDSLADYGIGELNDSISGLKGLYFVCTSSELKQGKLR